MTINQYNAINKMKLYQLAKLDAALFDPWLATKPINLQMGLRNYLKRPLAQTA